MAESNSTVPGFEAPPVHAGPMVLKRESAELAALNAFYDGIDICSLTVVRDELWQMPDDDRLVSMHFSARGKFANLVRHRFAHADWHSTPKCGYRHHRTSGFGDASVFKLKGGDYAVRYAWLDHALDLIAPVLIPSYLRARP